ncbi:MAG: MFS transporter [Acidimicrobiia bacterium]|nr:MFS transporter [Acidimicrobiia bacterium]
MGRAPRPKPALCPEVLVGEPGEHHRDVHQPDHRGRAAGGRSIASAAVTSATAHDLDSRRGWLAVVAAFFSSAVTLGTAYSFGAFFDSMAAEFDSDRSATAVIFGLTTFAFFFLSILTGRAVDRFGPRPILALGGVALLLGLVATSRVESLGVGYLTYGVGVGVAAACGYVPMVAVVGGWFRHRRAIAVGLAVAGIGVGTLVLSPVAAALVDRYGWRDTYVIFGVGGAAVLLGVCLPLTAAPPTDGRPSAARFGQAWASPTFRRLHLSASFMALALFVPFVFVGQHAKDRGVGPVPAAVLVDVLGGSSVVARVGFGTLVRRLGSFRLYRTCLAVHAASFLIWLVAGSSFALMALFVMVLGVGYGGFVSLSPIVLSDRLGVAGLGSVLGLFYTASGLGGLLGPPSAGWLIDRTDSYRWAILVAFALAATGFLLLLSLPVGADGRLERAADAVD